jgi:NitT/TauT family transport system ATP-binding protein
VPAASLQIRIDNARYARTDARGTQNILGPVSLDIHSGEFLSIVAPPASGKTTLVKLIAGVLSATAGEIRMSGKPRQEHSKGIGLVFSQPDLLGWRTVIQNILLQAELSGLDLEECRNRARRLLAWLGLSEFENSRPDEIPEGAGQLISLCRALIHNPSLLLMDEPFRMLDSLSLEKILDGFQRLWLEVGTTSLLCTGNMQEAILLSDRIAVMSPSPGRILQTFVVDLPRPRRFDKAMTPQIAEYCSRIRTLLRAHGVLP